MPLGSDFVSRGESAPMDVLYRQVALGHFRMVSPLPEVASTRNGLPHRGQGV